MYTIKEASARSGVGISLLRAWERRYGVVTPTRTASGYRLYDEAAIDRLRVMRALIANGWSAQQAAERVRASTEQELAALTEPVASSTELGVVAVDDDAEALLRASTRSLVTRLVDAARDIDAGAMEQALDEAFSAARFEVVADGVVMPALRAIGEAWERQIVSIAGEHAASQAVLRRLAMAYEAAGTTTAERPILVGLGPGSRHELGALAFAIAARRAGLPILYLGPDLPADSWSAAFRGRDARAAVIGTPTRADVRRARDVIDALRAAFGDIVIAVGGEQAPRAARESGALELPPALADSVRFLAEALRNGTAAAPTRS